MHLFVRGQVETVSATSITVKPKDGPPRRPARQGDDDVERIKAGDQVEMTCSQIAGTWVLTKVHKQ